MKESEEMRAAVSRMCKAFLLHAIEAYTGGSFTSIGETASYVIESLNGDPLSFFEKYCNALLDSEGEDNCPLQDVAAFVPRFNPSVEMCVFYTLQYGASVHEQKSGYFEGEITCFFDTLLSFADTGKITRKQ